MCGCPKEKNILVSLPENWQTYGSVYLSEVALKVIKCQEVKLSALSMFHGEKLRPYVTV